MRFDPKTQTMRLDKKEAKVLKSAAEICNGISCVVGTTDDRDDTAANTADQLLQYVETYGPPSPQEPDTTPAGSGDSQAESEPEGPAATAGGSDSGPTGVDWPAEAAHLAERCDLPGIRKFRENVDKNWKHAGDRKKMLSMCDDRIKAIKAGK